MEITNEIKAKVFAQYLMQPAIFQQPADEHSDYQYPPQKSIIGVSALGFGGPEDEFDYEAVSNWRVILKPLSAITDEDAIEVAKLEHIGIESLQTIEEGKFQSKSPSIKATSYQYLQSKGYDMPHYLFGGKTLYEAGLAIYED